MAAKKAGRRAGVEWVGGLVSLPAEVTGEGEPFRPELLVWMIPDGPVLGMTTGKPGELLPKAGDNFRDTMSAEEFGPAQTPSRVRVASKDLATAIAGAVGPGIDLVCAPTPELDELLAVMEESLAAGGGRQSFLGPDTDPEAVASFFRAAARLFRAKPWKVVPDDTALLSVTIPELGVHERVICVVGQMGQSHGVMVFSSLEDFDAFGDAADADERGEEPVVPAHFAMNFGPAEELRPELREEIAEHGWEIAGSQGFPWLMTIDVERVVRPPTPEELTIAEAIALALAEVVEQETELASAFDLDGEPLSRTLEVATHAGSIAVTLGAPHGESTEFGASSPDDLLAELQKLEDEHDGDFDHDRREAIETEIFHRFLTSSEGQTLPEPRVHYCDQLVDFAAEDIGVTLASLDDRDLREILFEIIPRQVSIDPSRAKEIVEELRAFFTFLERDFAHPHAAACLRVLGRDAAKRLERELGNPANFGVAKSMMMQAMKSGIDVSTPEGIEAWTRMVETMPLLPALAESATPAPRKVDPAAARAKKNKRKSERKARKKNR